MIGLENDANWYLAISTNAIIFTLIPDGIIKVMNLISYLALCTIPAAIVLPADRSVTLPSCLQRLYDSRHTGDVVCSSTRPDECFGRHLKATHYYTIFIIQYLNGLLRCTTPIKLIKCTCTNLGFSFSTAPELLQSFACNFFMTAGSQML